MTLLEYLRKDQKPYDTDLYCSIKDIDFLTLCDFSIANFKPDGLEEFADVLNVKVVRAGLLGYRNGLIRLIKLSGVSVDKKNKLIVSYAGYCDSTDYNRWFTMNDDESEETTCQQLQHTKASAKSSTPVASTST
jgi:hypothetical protein